MTISLLLSAWLAGVLGGGHCVAMCGGFAAAFAGGRRATATSLQPLRALMRSQLVHNAGRIATYGLLGAGFGSAGAMAMSLGAGMPLQRGLYVVANVLLLALALAIVRERARASLLEFAGAAAYRRLLPLVQPLASRSGLSSRFGLGLLWGLVPCALVYSVLPLALFAGSAAEGALTMLAFGLGTLPSLVAASVLAARMRRWLAHACIRYAVALLIGAFGIAGIVRALAADPGLARGAFCF